MRTDLCHMQIFMQYLPNCFFVNGHPLCNQSNTKPTIFLGQFFHFLGYCKWVFDMVGRRKRSSSSTSVRPSWNLLCHSKPLGSWHAFFAVNFHQSLNVTKNFKVNSLLSFRVKHFSAAVTELLATMSNLLLLQAKVFFRRAKKPSNLLSTSRYLICLKYNSKFCV